MADQVDFGRFSAEDIIERVRMHARLVTGYAMALAEQARMTPEEAADLFILHCLRDAPEPEELTLKDLGSWIVMEAAALEAVHGGVRVETDEVRYVLTISVADDLAALRLWSVSPSYWAAWMEGHVRRVAARHSLSATVDLHGDELHLRFAPGS